MALVTQIRGQRWGSILEDILIIRLNTTTNNSSKMHLDTVRILTIYSIGKSFRKLLGGISKFDLKILV